MEDKKLKVDITSTAVEKGLDTAKGFLEKLISPAIEETGLLIKESISHWRLKNQVKTLNKAREYCVKNNISPKAISLKLLCPLLENASLEEDEYLQDKWAALLSNLVDSEQNIENHVFPFLLGQISKREFQALEKSICAKRERVGRLQSERDEMLQDDKRKQRLRAAMEEADDAYGMGRGWGATSEMREELGGTFTDDIEIESEMRKPEYILDRLEAFEFANLVRLGVIKAISEHSVLTSTSGVEDNAEVKGFTLKDLQVEIFQDGEKYVATELGELFIAACMENKMARKL